MGQRNAIKLVTNAADDSCDYQKGMCMANNSLVYDVIKL